MDIEQIPENLAKQVAGAAGIRNRKDVAEFVTGEKQLKRESTPENIKVMLDKDKLDSEKQAVLEDILEFCENTTKDFEEKMGFLMEDYSNKEGAFTDQIRKKMEQKGYNLPQFTIYEGEKAEEVLKSTPDMENEDIKRDGFLVIFNLPKPLARFWYRGGKRIWGSGAKDIPEGNIEWGYFYRKAISAVWSNVDNQKPGGLYFDRINKLEEHDSKRYYYLWEVSRRRPEDDQPYEDEEYD